MSVFWSGFILSLSLISAIGAQNAFVLRQGLRRVFVWPVCLLCAVSDAILIVVGVVGFEYLTTRISWVLPAAKFGGAGFLIAYGLRSLWRAIRSRADMVDAESSDSLIKTLGICLAFTVLNPHVYLDTVILLGSISTQYAPDEWLFATGAISASFTFFFALGFGARILLPWFTKPLSWRILDGLIAMVMWSIAIVLILG